jgi:hypothetical protein
MSAEKFNKLRSELKAEGYKDSEIEAYIASLSKPSPQETAPKQPSLEEQLDSNEPIGTSSKRLVDQKKAEWKKEAEQKEVMGMPEWLLPAAGITTAAALGYAAKKGWDALKSKKVPTERIDPLMDKAQIPERIEPTFSPESKAPSPTLNALKDLAAAPKPGAAQPMQQPPAPTVAPQAPIAPQAPAAAPVATTPESPVVNTQQPNTSGAERWIKAQAKQAGIPPEQFPDFVQKLYGGETPAMGPHGGAPLGYQEKLPVYKKGNVPGPSINITPEQKEMLAKGVVPPGMTGKASLGVLGALAAAGMVAPSLVKAAQEGNWGGAALGALDTATDVIPATAGIKAAGQALGMHGNLNAGEQEWIDKQNYNRQVGGGRGMAPPSAYIPVDPKEEWEKLRKAGIVFGQYDKNGPYSQALSKAKR